jgi:hypothetical protein
VSARDAEALRLLLREVLDAERAIAERDCARQATDPTWVPQRDERTAAIIASVRAELARIEEAK